MEAIGKFAQKAGESIYNSVMNFDIKDPTYIVTIIVTVAMIVISLFHQWYKSIRTPIVVRIPELDNKSKTGFRNRDKVQFLARKVLRKGKDAASRLQRQASAIKEGVSIPKYSRSGRQLRKRERMYILAKRVFRVKRDPPALLKKELPSSLLEAKFPEEQNLNLPEEVLYLLQSVKVFGHFEKGIFLQLCSHLEILTVPKDKYLFRVGDADEYMYVVQEGQINLFISENDQEIKLSEFTPGESLHSLISILDVLTGHAAPYKTVFARAMKDSTIIRLPVHAFNAAFENNEQALVQVVQVVMTRMQRVTFLALHNYLGLSRQLLSQAKSLAGTQKLSVHSLSRSSYGSQDSPSMEEVDGSFEETDSAIAAAPIQPTPILCKGKSDIDKSKILRFGEYETVVDFDDNVFRRQTSTRHDNKTTFPHTKIMRQEQVTLQNEPSVVSDTFVMDEKSSDEDKDDFSNQDSVEDNCFAELDEPEILDLVVQDLLLLLGMKDKNMLRENVTLLKVPQGTQLIREGDQDVSLYFVVTGILRVSQSIAEVDHADASHDVTLFHTIPGHLTGQLAVLTGEPSFFSVQALRDSVVAKLSRNDFYAMMRHSPRIVLSVAHTVVQRLSKFTRQIDFALDWTRVEAGKALYRQDSVSDCIYIILNGRLRSVRGKSDGKKELVTEYGRGEVVGLTEALRGTSRNSSVLAVRDTEMAKIPEGLLKHIRRQHPGVVSRLMSLMSEKLMGNIMSNKHAYGGHPGELLSHKHQMGEETRFAYGDVSNHLANLSTVAILPLDQHVPLDKFCLELEHALQGICDDVLHLNSGTIKKRLGQNAFDQAQEYRLTSWLAQQEDLHRIVLYQTDDHMSDWTQRCIRQSDAILIVALGEGEPKVGKLEQELENYSVRALKVLVMLHRSDVSQPSRTTEWLNMRTWLTEHLHVKAPKRLFTPTRKSKLPEYRQKLSRKEVDRFSDFSRLSRFLTGKTVALVLGGGGARGVAQLGIIQALLESGIPIDQVGGTSFGAFFGALWACHRDLDICRSLLIAFCAQIGSVIGQIFDLTYPLTSMFSGKGFNRTIHCLLKDTQIEDMWLPYFVVTTDVTNPKMRVHTDGSLWRYVRASMTLSGYLPPICDPKDGHLLMDGGYINNLPGDVARSRGASRVIAVDVGALWDADFTNYGDHLSGWWLLYKKWTGRWTGSIRVPDMNEIQSRLSYISCYYLMDLVINSDYCTYLRPPIVKYGTLDFSKWSEIIEVGYKYGKEFCSEEWTRKFLKDLLKSGHGRLHDSIDGQHRNVEDPRRRSVIANMKANTSFTDLSSLLTVQESNSGGFEFSDLEYELGYESSPELNNVSLNLRHIKGSLSETDEAYVGEAVSQFRSFSEMVASEENEKDDDDPTSNLSSSL